MIKAELTILGKKYKGSGKTVKSALKKIKAPVTKGVGILVVQGKDKKRERVLNAITATKLFGMVSPTTKELTLNNYVTMFSDIE